MHTAIASIRDLAATFRRGSPSPQRCKMQQLGKAFLSALAITFAGCANATIDRGAWYDHDSIENAIDAWIDSGHVYGPACERDRDELVIVALPYSVNACEGTGCPNVVGTGDDPVLVVSAEPERRRATTIAAATLWLEACARMP